MFSRFFINRPIFAAVVSILIVLIGSVALVSLPVKYGSLSAAVVRPARAVNVASKFCLAAI